MTFSVLGAQQALPKTNISTKSPVEPLEGLQFPQTWGVFLWVASEEFLGESKGQHPKATGT